MNKKILNKNNRNNRNSGFIALTTVLIVSSLILAFLYLKSTEISYFFEQVQLKKARIIIYYNIGNCIDQAILNLTKDYFYEISTTTEYFNLHCSIDMVKEENGFKIIKASGNLKNIILKRQASVRLYDNRLEVISIE